MVPAKSYQYFNRVCSSLQLFLTKHMVDRLFLRSVLKCILHLSNIPIQLFSCHQIFLLVTPLSTVSLVSTRIWSSVEISVINILGVGTFVNILLILFLKGKLVFNPVFTNIIDCSFQKSTSRFLF